MRPAQGRPRLGIGTIVAESADVEIQDGFIVGIYNYCDRWCEACRFTSWCRLFADKVEMEASLDPLMKAIVNAPPLGHELPPEPPAWVAEFIDELNEDARESARDADREDDRPLTERMRPTVAAEHQMLGDFALGYLLRLHDWLKTQSGDGCDDASDPRGVISWFGTLFPAKIHRAVLGLTESIAEGPDDWPADYDGSAKIALIAIDRSHAAWLDAVERSLIAATVAAPFITDLAWLADELEKTFPNARAFVRPAFDEPDEVVRLLGRMDS